jgi:hypothetical protein
VHDQDRWRLWVKDLGGPPVHLLWVRSDAETLRERLLDRGSPRDTGKLSDFSAFLEAIKVGEPPAVPYLEIDNRLGARPMDEQLAGYFAADPGSQRE